MYSGHNLIYAFKLTMEDIKNIFNLDNDDIDIDIDNNYEIMDYLEDFFSDNQFNNLELICLPCCYHSDEEVFLGFRVGYLFSQYRSEICDYNNIEEYYSKYFEMIDDSKKKYIDSINKFHDDIDILFSKFPVVKDYISKNDIKFYTIPNDCESCT